MFYKHVAFYQNEIEKKRNEILSEWMSGFFRSYLARTNELTDEKKSHENNFSNWIEPI